MSVDKQLEELALADARHVKILLLGAGESGKSTVVKQVHTLIATLWCPLKFARVRFVRDRQLTEILQYDSRRGT